MKDFSKKEKRSILKIALKRHIKKNLDILGWIVLLIIIILVSIFVLGILAYKMYGEPTLEFGMKMRYVFGTGTCWLITSLIGCGIAWFIIWLVSTEIKSIKEEYEEERHQQICKAEAQKNAEENLQE